MWAEEVRASSEKLDKLEDMTTDKEISAYLEELAEEAESGAGRDPFAGYTDEDDGSERWIVAAKLPDNTRQFVDWFNAARFRTRTSREDGARPGVYHNVRTRGAKGVRRDRWNGEGGGCPPIAVSPHFES